MIQILQQAHLMMGSALAMRTYTSEQVGRLLQEHQAQINSFLARTVPTYAATESSHELARPALWIGSTTRLRARPFRCILVDHAYQ